MCADSVVRAYVPGESTRRHNNYKGGGGGGVGGGGGRRGNQQKYAGGGGEAEHEHRRTPRPSYSDPNVYGSQWPAWLEEFAGEAGGTRPVSRFTFYVSLFTSYSFFLPFTHLFLFVAHRHCLTAPHVHRVHTHLLVKKERSAC